MLTLDDVSLHKSLCLIDGRWVAGDAGHLLEVRNPATGESVGSVPKLGASETRRAIAAAQRAGPAWRAVAIDERAAILRRWCELVLRHADDLALLMTSEQGKPLDEARGEIQYAASYLEWYAEEVRRIYGEIAPSPWPDRRVLVTREPVGVCAAITPWNFPAAMITRKVAPALAAGCTMVVKPASQTPLTALALGELAVRAGVPAGVLSVVTGAASEIGAELTGNPAVRKLSFTGSTEIGRKLAAQCAPTLKKLSLELGGNAPFIVFDDADLDAAVEGAIASKYRNTGQTCVCTNRLLVHDSVYDEFAARLARAVAGLKVGNGLDPGVQQGPLIDRYALAKVEELVADALAKGGQIVAGGRRHALGGTYYEPTVITGATAEMKIAREEVFGPVAPLFRFKTEAAAVAIANDTDFGLASYFYTTDLGRAFHVAEQLEYGMVGINTGLISTASAPFGGVKQSGYGREGARQGLDEYLQLKYTCLGLGQPPRAGS